MGKRYIQTGLVMGILVILGGLQLLKNDPASFTPAINATLSASDPSEASKPGEMGDNQMGSADPSSRLTPKTTAAREAQQTAQTTDSLDLPEEPTEELRLAERFGQAELLETVTTKTSTTALKRHLYSTEFKFAHILIEEQFDASGTLLSETAMVADHLLVQFDGTKPALEARTGYSVQALGAPNLFRVDVSAPSSNHIIDSFDTVLAELQAMGLQAEPDYIVTVSEAPNDTAFHYLYGLENTDTPGADISAIEAWELFPGTSDSIIGIIDSGVDISHPDLASNIWVNAAELPNGIDDDSNGLIDDITGWDFYGNHGEMEDLWGHGTHVAGIAGAVGNNDRGVIGVHYTGKILPLRFMNAFGSGTISDAIRSLYYARDLYAAGHPVHMTCNSWGGNIDSASLRAALDQIELSGQLMINAAGNGGYDGRGDDVDLLSNYPTSYSNENMITVANTDKNDELAWSSNFGLDTVDLAAPGERIYSTLHEGRYTTKTGTSMSAPMVAGGLSLLMTLDPSMTTTEARDILFSSVDQLPNLNGKLKTGGRMNLAAAIREKAMLVDSSEPAAGAFLYEAPIDFELSLDDAFDPTSVTASDFLVNGVPADQAVVLSPTQVRYSFATSPVQVEGEQDMRLNRGGLTRASDGFPVLEWVRQFDFDETPLQVVMTSPAMGSDVALPFTELEISFNESVDPTSLSLADVSVSRGQVTSFTQLSSRRFRFVLDAIVGEGPVSFGIPAGSVENLSGFGNLPFSAIYFADEDEVQEKAWIQLEPRGVFACFRAQDAYLGPNDTDRYAVELIAGQSYTAQLEAGFQATLSLRGPNGGVIQSSSDGKIGPIEMTTSGAYELEIRNGSGDYRIGEGLNLDQASPASLVLTPTLWLADNVSVASIYGSTNTSKHFEYNATTNTSWLVENYGPGDLTLRLHHNGILVANVTAAASRGARIDASSYGAGLLTATITCDGPFVLSAVEGATTGNGSKFSTSFPMMIPGQAIGGYTPGTVSQIFRLPTNIGDELDIELVLPNAYPASFENRFAGELRLLDFAGRSILSHSNKIEYTVTSSKTFYLEVRPTGAGGEYLLRAENQFANLRKVIVENDFGTGSPAAGTNLVTMGDFEASVSNLIFVSSGERLRCTGFAGAGSIGQGSDASTGTIDLKYHSRVTWQWVEEVYVSAQASANGSVNLTPAWMTKGANVSIQATPDTGYRFTGWSGDSTSTQASLNFPANSAFDVTAQFERIEHELVIVSANGQPTPLAGSYTYSDGDVISATMQPSEIEFAGFRYRCTGWEGSGDAPSSGSTTQVPDFSLTQDSRIEWMWSTDAELKLNTIGNGALSQMTQWVPAGQSRVITATPANGWRFVQWQGDIGNASATQSSLTLFVAEPKSLVAIFEPIQVQLEVISALGSPSPTLGIQTYNQGTMIEANMPQSTIYHDGIRSVLDGWNLSNGESGTNQMVPAFSLTANRQLEWLWHEEAFLSASIEGPTGTTLGNILGNLGWLAIGHTITLVAEPEDGFVFDYWIGLPQNQNALKATQSLTIAESLQLEAHFIAIEEPEPAPDPLPNPEPVPEPEPNPVPEPSPEPEPNPEPEPEPNPEPPVQPETTINGIPQSWFQTYSIPEDPNGDSDGDGMSNQEEWFSGSNPSDPTDYLGINAIDPSTWTLQWSAEAGKRYRLEASSTLDGSYQLVASGIPSGSTVLPPVYRGKQYFFRVYVLP